MAIAEDPKRSQSTGVADATAVRDVADGTARVRQSPAPGAHGTKAGESTQAALGLSPSERRLLSDLFAIVSEHATDSAIEIDRARVQDAFVFACEHHADQRRKSGEDFIVHPVGVARICASMRLDTETLCAALLHDTVEDTSASIEEVRERFGEEIATLVDGVTKLTGITFQSRDEAQAENYRKMMVAMADRRPGHPDQARRPPAQHAHDRGDAQAEADAEGARDARHLRAAGPPPRHPRDQVGARGPGVRDAAPAQVPGDQGPCRPAARRARALRQRGRRVPAQASCPPSASRREIAGRAKHFYSIYSKMTNKGREFNEIYDLTAMRVIVDSVKDCYGAVGVIHSLWKPLPGRFKDFIAMPKFNMYQSLHTTVIGPEGQPLEIQIRTQEMHEMAEFGVAAHWVYKQPDGAGDERSGWAIAGEDAKLKWLRSMLDWQKELSDPNEFMETLRTDLFEDEVLRLHAQGRSQVAGGRRHAAGLRLRGAHRDRPPLRGRAREREDRAAALRAAVGRHRRDPHRQARARTLARLAGDGQDDPRAQQDQGLVQGRVRARTPSTPGASCCRSTCANRGCRRRRSRGSALLADVIREVGYRKADDFYIALGAAKVSPKLVVNKVMQRLKQGESADGGDSAADLLRVGRARRRPTKSSGQYGIRVEGVEDVMLRLAKCCRPVPGDEIVGYISLGRGITIHREDCPNATLLRKSPERFTSVSWEGDQSTGFVVEIQIDAWDRHHLLADLSRAFSESGANILEARCLSMPPMVKNRFVVEVADTHSLKSAITRLRNTESVFDAYRVTPGAAA